MTAAAEMPDDIIRAAERAHVRLLGRGTVFSVNVIAEAILAERHRHSAVRRIGNADAAAIRRIIDEGGAFADTKPEARFIADAELSCPHCGGSGHKDDVRDQWQDISTAPENRAILIHVPGLDYYGNNGVYAGMLVNMGTGKRWMTFGHAIGRDLGPEVSPTHWQQLQAAPKGGVK